VGYYRNFWLKKSWQQYLTQGRDINTLRKARALPKASKKKWRIMDMHEYEAWEVIPLFPDYSVSNYGRVRSDKFERILALNVNQYGLVQVGLMRDGIQHHRSVPLLVAKAFLPPLHGPFDTPINLDGDRYNNHVENLTWRPRWFAIKYNQQFRHPYHNSIQAPIIDLKTDEVSENSFECAKRYGLLEEDLVLSILNRTYVWPTYQEFGVLED
jgi:NUMOD4 motif